MINKIIAAVIDAYDQTLTAMQEELKAMTDTLKAMTEKYEKADDANIELRKENTTLQRGLTAAHLERLSIMDHLIAAVAFIPSPTGKRCASASTSELRDALYAIPADATTAVEQTHIDALVAALDKGEVG